MAVRGDRATPDLSVDVGRVHGTSSPRGRQGGRGRGRGRGPGRGGRSEGVLTPTTRRRRAGSFSGIQRGGEFHRARSVVRSAAEALEDTHDERCDVCNDGGDLLCCDSCSRVYHLGCLGMVESDIPRGKWECAYCTPGDQINIKIVRLFMAGVEVDPKAPIETPPAARGRGKSGGKGGGASGGSRSGRSGLPQNYDALLTPGSGVGRARGFGRTLKSPSSASSRGSRAARDAPLGFIHSQNLQRSLLNAGSDVGGGDGASSADAARAGSSAAGGGSGGRGGRGGRGGDPATARARGGTPSPRRQSMRVRSRALEYARCGSWQRAMARYRAQLEADATGAGLITPLVLELSDYSSDDNDDGDSGVAPMSGAGSGCSGCSGAGSSDEDLSDSLFAEWGRNFGMNPAAADEHRKLLLAAEKERQRITRTQKQRLLQRQRKEKAALERSPVLKFWRVSVDAPWEVRRKAVPRPKTPKQKILEMPPEFWRGHVYSPSYYHDLTVSPRTQPGRGVFASPKPARSRPVTRVQFAEPAAPAARDPAFPPWSGKGKHPDRVISASILAWKHLAERREAEANAAGTEPLSPRGSGSRKSKASSRGSGSVKKKRTVKKKGSRSRGGGKAAKSAKKTSSRGGGNKSAKSASVKRKQAAGAGAQKKPKKKPAVKKRNTSSTKRKTPVKSKSKKTPVKSKSKKTPIKSKSKSKSKSKKKSPVKPKRKASSSDASPRKRKKPKPLPTKRTSTGRISVRPRKYVSSDSSE